MRGKLKSGLRGRKLKITFEWISAHLSLYNKIFSLRSLFQRGIVLCGTGLGISIAANKIKGIRCALCNDVYSAKMSREHNNANVLAMGGRVIGFGPAGEIVRAWLITDFAGGRHARRVDKIMALENRQVKSLCLLKMIS